MKKLIITVFLGILLTACGGGGGGGSSGGGGTQYDTVSSLPIINFETENAVQVNGVSNITSTPTLLTSDTGTSLILSTMRYAVTNFGSVKLEKNQSGLKLTYWVKDFDATRNVVDMSMSSTQSDFKEAPGSDYIFADKTSTLRLDQPNLNGEVSYRDVVYLGGLSVGLEHADFGTWKQAVSTNFVGNGKEHKLTERFDLAFIIYDANSLMPVAAGTGEKIFAGKTIGGVHDEKSGKHADISGIATMTLPLDNLTGSTLLLSFKNFYDFTVTFDASAVDGKVNAANLAVTFDDNGNTSGITLEKSYDSTSNRLQIMFLGDGVASQPSEAAGLFDFRILDHDMAQQVVNTAFGVKSTGP